MSLNSMGNAEDAVNEKQYRVAQRADGTWWVVDENDKNVAGGGPFDTADDAWEWLKEQGLLLPLPPQKNSEGAGHGKQYRVAQKKDGTWWVVDENNKDIKGPFKSADDAWKWLKKEGLLVPLPGKPPGPKI